MSRGNLKKIQKNRIFFKKICPRRPISLPRLAHKTSVVRQKPVSSTGCYMPAMAKKLKYPAEYADNSNSELSLPWMGVRGIRKR
jgi:hypothetical protein